MPPKAKPDVPADPLEALLASINSVHGAGTILLLGSDPLPVADVISTGSIALDEAIGVGGLPRGRIIELYGPESSGKTSIALRALAQFQAAGLRGAFIDAEHALDPDWAAVLGVDTDKMLVSQPDNGEQALEVADRLAKSGQVGIIVIDSVAALVPRAEIEGSMGDSHMGLHARLMSQALRKLTGAANETKTTIIFINQLREKIGVLFGSPETTTGGKALKFYASLRLDVRHIETLKDGTVPVGKRVRVKAVKNKVAPPFRSAELDLMFEQGFSREGELLDMGVERGVIGKSGVYYSYMGQTIGQGKEKARAMLATYPVDLLADIEAAIRAAKPATPQAAARKSAALSSSAGPAPWEPASDSSPAT